MAAANASKAIPYTKPGHFSSGVCNKAAYCKPAHFFPNAFPSDVTSTPRHSSMSNTDNTKHLPPQFVRSTTFRCLIPTPSSTKRTNFRRHKVAKPSHKMHPTPRLFQKFHNHPRLPSNLAQTNLSPTAIQTVDYALQHGWAEATLANYGNAMDRFIAFCTTEGVPSDLQLPADKFVLCAFAASGAGVHAGSTARNNIAALKAWHVVQGIEWRGGSRLHYVLTGVEKLAPESSKRPPRPPINATMLRILRMCSILGTMSTRRIAPKFPFTNGLKVPTDS
ncbi:hypothetical protein K438DRAFT_2145201 [Mycena galopus ATCC 62051]|nr:hypothetical protein K438DRAFT_2145201 [Mycena galopus ATCC 62051]